MPSTIKCVHSPIACYVLAPGTWPCLAPATARALSRAKLWLCHPQLDPSHLVACPPGTRCLWLSPKGHPKPLRRAVFALPPGEVIALSPTPGTQHKLRATLRRLGLASRIRFAGTGTGSLPAPRVILTRAPAHNQRLGAKLLCQGHSSLSIPTMRYRHGAANLGQLLASQFDGFDLIVSSPQGAKALGPHRALAGSRRLAAVGQATARELKAQGLACDLVPSQANSEGLVQSLRAHGWLDQKWLHLRGPVGRDVLGPAIRASQGAYECLPVYHIERPRLIPALVTPLRKMIAGPSAPLISFASEQSYLRFCQQLRDAGAKELLDPLFARAKILSFGPVTTKALNDQGHSVHAQLPSPCATLQLQWLREQLERQPP